jgi:hypothetical protein
MKKIVTPILLSGLILLFFGCGSDIHISDYIDETVSLNLSINKKNKNGLTSSENNELTIDSEKYKQVIAWANKNTSGWKWTPASYLSDVCVAQGDFRLLYTSGSNRVVVGFVDKQGKAKQYAKKINKGDLDFLYK